MVPECCSGSSSTISHTLLPDNLHEQHVEENHVNTTRSTANRKPSAPAKCKSTRWRLSLGPVPLLLLRPPQQPSNNRICFGAGQSHFCFPNLLTRPLLPQMIMYKPGTNLNKMQHVLQWPRPKKHVPLAPRQCRETSLKLLTSTPTSRPPLTKASVRTISGLALGLQQLLQVLLGKLAREHGNITICVCCSHGRH